MRVFKNLNQLKELVNEVSLPRPNEKRVKELMQVLGMEYCPNPIERLEKIFMSVNIEGEGAPSPGPGADKSV